MGQIWARIGRGCPPSTPRHFWVIFGKTHLSLKNSNNVGKSWNVHGPENRFFLRNHKNQKDARRHNSTFRGPMTSPSSIWSPFVKKRVLAKSSILLLIVVHAQESCACIRFLCMLCMHEILVHAQNSCACTRILCMHKTLVHALDSCACTRILCRHKCCLN